MRSRQFSQVDVFSTQPYAGNPVAVVIDAEGLGTEEMRRFARWTNLSETTFLLPAEDPAADYRLRIFTPGAELPFAGHPTLGSCHAWLESGGVPRESDVIVQECGAGLVRVRHTDAGLAFAAPPLLRSGTVEEELLARVCDGLHVNRAAVVDSQWIDNGPGWLGILLGSADEVLALRPGPLDIDPEVGVGVVGPYPAGAPEAYEVRALFQVDGATIEDPVTGSLNASLAGWLTESGRANPPYVASQGTVIGRRGRIHISRDETGQIWTGGATATCVRGDVTL